MDAAGEDTSVNKETERLMDAAGEDTSVNKSKLVSVPSRTKGSIIG
jgi:hypothetical protein